MKQILYALLITGIAGPAFAGVMDSRFGNTTVIKDGGGGEAHLYYKADGTLTGKSGSDAITGTWKLEGDKVCLSTNKPVLTLPNPACVPTSEHKVGDSWMAAGFSVTLVGGIK